MPTLPVCIGNLQIFFIRHFLSSDYNYCFFDLPSMPLLIFCEFLVGEHRGSAPRSPVKFLRKNGAVRLIFSAQNRPVIAIAFLGLSAAVPSANLLIRVIPST